MRLTEKDWTRAAAIFVLSLFIGLGSAMAQTDPNAGIPQFSTQLGGQYDHINPATNIFISIPIRDKYGKTPVSLSLISNFSMFTAIGSTAWSGTPGSSLFSFVMSAGVVGARVTFVSHQTPFTCQPGKHFTQYDTFVVFDETGASHPINGGTIVYADPSCGSQQATAMTLDGSGYTLNLTVIVDANGGSTLNYALSDKSGNVQTQTQTHTANTGTVAYVNTDPDGVQSTRTFSTTSGVANSTSVLVDSLGQTAITATERNPGVNPGSPNTYQYTDSSGAPQTVTVNFTPHTIQTNFGCGYLERGETDYLPSSITLPDGEAFDIQYEPTPGNASAVTGRIAKLTLPLGGSISYAYSGGNNGIYCAFPGLPNAVPILTRTVDDGRGNISTWTYTNSNNTGGNGPYTAAVTDPLGNVTVYTFSVTSETKRQVYQGAASPQNLLETVITCYNGDFTNCAAGQSLPIYGQGAYS